MTKPKYALAVVHADLNPSNVLVRDGSVVALVGIGNAGRGTRAIHTLATTVDTWQAPIIAAIDTGLSDARSEGYNRIVKHIGRIAFGFRNTDNQRRRIRWACTRRTRPVPSRITALRPC